MVDPSNGPRGPGQGSSTSEDLKGDARELKDTAVQQGEARADREKQRAGRAATSASSAMQTAADELRDDDNAPDWLASAFSGLARQVDDFAGRLQNESPRKVAGETSRFARDNPTAFFAASAAAGFAAARFLRAGAEYHDDYQIGSDGGSDTTRSSRATTTPTGEIR